MFDPDFFPTPGSVIDRMLAPYTLQPTRGDEQKIVATILEPSAGKGDILDSIKKRCNGGWGHGYYGPRLMAIERNPELVSILQGKGYSVVANDFLTYTPEIHADLIVMNPPFSDGDSHLLHAWEILRGGDIACLLNAETVRNPYTQERKLLAKIIEDHGSIEYLGQVFRGAERSTDVEVALVRLHKEKTGPDELDFDFTVPEGEADEMPEDAGEATGSAVMRPDQIGAMIRCYDQAKKAFVDYLKAREAMDFYCRGILGSKLASEIADETVSNRYSYTRQKAYDQFRDGLRLQFWTHILQQLGVEKLLTSDLRNKFGEFIVQQGAMALTKENISNILRTILMNSDSIMKQAVVAVFDLFTKYHKENQHHPEGWKTNEKWMVGKRVILPNGVCFEYGRFRVGWHAGGQIADIDKAMCYLVGKRLEDIVTIDDAIKERESTGESTFFKLRYYKKGTLHLEFKDTALWARFNQVAVDGRNWIPDRS